MKLDAPSYYRDFVCIADKCHHSCCIGWEIDVDHDTMKKYTSLTDGYGKEIAKSIECEDVPHFRLDAGDRCPHLNNIGLCNIILMLGEDYLCDICREHPRFYHDTVKGKEVGLGMACEEACRLILTSDAYHLPFIEVGEVDGEAGTVDFDALPHRARLYAILSEQSIPYAARLLAISEAYEVSPTDLSDGEWRELLASLEYLDPAHKSLFAQYSSDSATPTAFEKPLERALAYFIFRHCTDVEDEEALRCALGFALFCERLLASVASALGVSDTDGLVRLAQAVSEELEYSEDNTEEIKSVFLV